MASQVMRITLKAYDHQLIDQSAGKIIETVKKTGSQVSGPVPLPTKKEVVTILRAVHKSKIPENSSNRELIRDSSISRARARRQLTRCPDWKCRPVFISTSR